MGGAPALAGHNTATTPQACIGDIRVGVHNVQGMSPLSVAGPRLTRDIQSGVHIKGYVETGWGTNAAAAYKNKVEGEGTYWLHVAAPEGKKGNGQAGLGAALLVEKGCTRGQPGEGSLYECPRGGKR